MLPPTRTLRTALASLVIAPALVVSTWGMGGTALASPAVAVSPSATAPSSTASAAATARKITLTRTSPQRVEAGTRVRFTGTADSLKGKRIVLQRKSSGKWKTAGAAKVSARGNYAVSGKAQGAGVNTWRTYVVTKVTKRGKKRIETRTYSATRSMWSLQWFHLYDAKNRDSHLHNRYEASIGGTRYAKSFGPRNGTRSGHTDAYLWGGCDTFRASIGQDDDSESGSRTRFVLSQDGAPRDLGVRGKGKAQSVSVDVRGVQILRLGTERVTTAGHHWGMWGNPRVLCQRQP